MNCDDPADMPNEDRLEDLAALLAAGFLRLKRRTGCVPSESAGSSLPPSDSAWQPSETTALCPPR